jgi:hypothetical protein
MKDQWMIVNERQRSYDFPNRELPVTFYDVTRLYISSSGTHYLEGVRVIPVHNLSDIEIEGKFIVEPTGRVIEIDADEWTYPEVPDAS